MGHTPWDKHILGFSEEEERYQICNKCGSRMAGESWHGPACQCKEPEFIPLAPSEMKKFYEERGERISEALDAEKKKDKDRSKGSGKSNEEGEGRMSSSRR